MNRLLQFFSIALVTGLLFDLGAIVFYTLWSIKLNFPFFFEILFLYLVLRELPRWRLEKIAVLADSKFNLKDRLYSHLWYTNNKSVPETIRSAQIRETVNSVDLDALVRTTRIRIPATLIVTIPLFSLLLYVSWNAAYIPPGITTRITSLPSFPKMSNGPLDIPSRDTAVKNQSQAIESMEDEAKRSGREDRNAELPAEDRADPQATSDQGELVEDDEPVDSRDPTAAGSGNSKHSAGGMKDPGSENLASNPVSSTASAPVPPNLAADATQSFLELPDASNFLDLVPGQGSGTLADLDEEIILVFEEDLERFPDRYRAHLQNYYWELKKWSLNQ